MQLAGCAQAFQPKASLLALSHGDSGIVQVLRHTIAAMPSMFHQSNQKHHRRKEILLHFVRLIVRQRILC